MKRKTYTLYNKYSIFFQTISIISFYIIIKLFLIQIETISCVQPQNISDIALENYDDFVLEIHMLVQQKTRSELLEYHAIHSILLKNDNISEIIWNNYLIEILNIIHLYVYEKEILFKNLFDTVIVISNNNINNNINLQFDTLYRKTNYEIYILAKAIYQTYRIHGLLNIDSYKNNELFKYDLLEIYKKIVKEINNDF